MVEGRSAAHWSVEDHVSLDERLTTLRWTRVTVAAGTLLGLAVTVPSPLIELLVAGGMFVVVGCLDLLVKLRLDRGERPSSLLLLTSVLADGAAIVVALYLAGGSDSPVRYAVVIHGATTALLLSREMALGSAVWVSLLVLSSYEMQELGLLAPVEAVDGNRLTTSPEIGGLLIALWVATALTATASAINERVLMRERLDQHIHASFGQATEGVRDAVTTARTLAEHVLRTGRIEQVVVIDTREEPIVLAIEGERPGADVVLTASPGSLLGEVVTKRTTVHVRTLDIDDDADLRQLLGDVRNVSAVPMIAAGEVVGLLLVVHGANLSVGLQRNTVENYKRLASHAALAFAATWAHEALDRQAGIDQLTAIPNRLVFDEQFDRELSRARRERTPVSLVLCDLDHFKRINEEHGHREGDRMLADVAQTLERERRPYDLVARNGSDEFAVLLSQADHNEAMRVAERMRRAVEGVCHECGLTASFGVASADDGVASRADLVVTADACLRTAKLDGRNRVEGATTRLFSEAGAETGPTTS